MDSASDSIKESIPNRYSLVVLAAKRAKQIREGAPLLIDTDSPNSLTVALEEIAAGKISVIEAVEPPPRVPAAVAPSASYNLGAPSAMEMLDASLAEAERAAHPEAVEDMAEMSDDGADADEDADQADSEAEQDGYAGASTSASEEE